MKYTTPFEPDIDDLVTVIKREGSSTRLHFLELFIDQEIKDILIQQFLPEQRWDEAIGNTLLQKEIAIHRFLGYEFFRVPFIRKSIFNIDELTIRDTTSERQSRGDRAWTDEHAGPIQSWEDFEAYRWPRLSELDFSTFEWLENHLPRNMGFFDLTGHILEVITFLFGFETLSMMLYDDIELVRAVSGRVGAFYVEYTEILADLDASPIIWGADDMGFRSSLLMPLDFLREQVLPWHKKCAEVAHTHGKPYLLHSCGRIDELMEDFICDVKIDGKHSFEDAIMPVTEAYEKYGDRISILGGIDVDYLIRADEKDLRKRVRDTLDACLEGEGYCFGSGNTIANYVPVERFLIMLQEAAGYAST